MRYFETRFLEEADEFISQLDPKSAGKILYNIDLAEQTNDPRRFKKINNEIREFRSTYLGKQFRLPAFWDKTQHSPTLVFATHGFIKKGNKVPLKEIARAEHIKEKYFNNK